jgi:hypothetical protein
LGRSREVVDHLADASANGQMGSGDGAPVWLPVRGEILIGPSRDGFETGDCSWYGCSAWLHPILLDLQRANAGALRFRRVRELYPQYTATDLLSHPAAILMPYAPSTIAAQEFYRLGIPLFAPTQRLLLDWHGKYGYLHERIYGTPPQIPSLMHPAGRDEALRMPPPNSDEPEHAVWWLQWFDIYQWPHIRLFDSWDALCAELATLVHTDPGLDALAETSRRMHDHSANVARQSLLVWRDILRDIRIQRQTHDVLRRERNETLEARLRRLYGNDVWPIAQDGGCLAPHPRQAYLFADPTDIVPSSSLYVLVVLPWAALALLAFALPIVRFTRKFHR